MKPKTAAVIFLVLIILINGCAKEAQKGGSEQRSAETPEETAPAALKGVSLSPKSFRPDDFIGFFAKAKEAGNALLWAGDWGELADTQEGAPTVVSALAGNYNLLPVIEAQFFTQSTGRLLRPLDDETKKAYLGSAAAFAEKFKPQYMGFGIEVNMLYEKSPDDFEEFAKLFSEVHDAVKAVSPETKVFTVFQLEKMKGMGGGLFGGRNDASKSQWGLLEKFPKADLAAFTTYPGLVYKSPSEIPADYYSAIKQHTSKDIAFTEIGWHSASSPIGWESNNGEQDEFVKRFFELTKGMGSKITIWSFLYDPDTIEPFNSMGLYSRGGGKKPAFDAWVSG
ncbi:MAG TPA: hypothetical protein HA362_08230 [Nanoarchaeota archaeon]|nr:hypothetical protein [Nanoarchaeota archaeon]